MEVTWQGERHEQLRASFTLFDRQSVVQELAALKSGGKWIMLGQNLIPDFEVTSGVRRLSEQQFGPLRPLNLKLTPELIEREKLNAFWDAPLVAYKYVGGLKALVIPTAPAWSGAIGSVHAASEPEVKELFTERIC